VVLVAPILAFGQVIARRATVPDTALYGGFGFESWTPVLVGSVRELSVLHDPWREELSLEVTDNDTSSLFIRALGYGIPDWVGVLVLGGVLLVAFGLGRAALRRTTADRPADPDGATDAGTSADPAAAPAQPTRRVRTIGVLAAALIVGILLYPPALRLSNALTAGVDNGIVARYSIAFAPLLVWVALLATRDLRGYSRLLAGLGLLSVTALCVSAW
jgi:hypothetical protein